MQQSQQKSNAGSSKPMRIGMIACCAVMLLPIAAYVLAAGDSGGVPANLWIFAPLLVCVGAHFVMHARTGRSCHGQSAGTGTPDTAPVRSEPGAGRPGGPSVAG